MTNLLVDEGADSLAQILVLASAGTAVEEAIYSVEPISWP
jgi:hypothetical protein